ncbi:helix-turn-helix domain-containing protein [Flavobacterium sp. U410]
MQEKDFEPITITFSEYSANDTIVRNNRKFFLIYILSGRGIFTKQNTPIIFSSGSLFFITPFENFSVRPTEMTRFYSVSFTDSFRNELRELVLNSKGRSVNLSKAVSPLNKKITFSEKDEPLVYKIFEFLKAIYEEPNRNEDLFFYPILTLISIIERNTPNPHINTQIREKKDINDILAHIHKNIERPEFVRIQYIAQKFNYSANQMGRFFLKKMNVTLKKYVDQYRIDLIKEKIENEDLTFSEISHQFGFTDESHFTKVFKRHFGLNPTEFRRIFVENKSK